jgi:tetratricopeptide (TPR) repeat protein
MKQVAFLFTMVIIFSGCTRNKTAKVEKLNLPERAIVDSLEKVAKDTVKQRDFSKMIKPAKPMTEEEKKKKENERRAHTAFKTAMDAYNKGDYETATEKLRECLAYDPKNSIAGYNLGKIYYDQKQPDLALSYFEDAIAANPEDTASMVAAGLIYLEKNDFDKAKEFYDKAIAVAPHFGDAYFHRGTLYGTHKHYKESLADLRKAALYDPGNAEIFVNLGLAYFYLKERDSACMAWQKAADMGNPKGKQAVNAYCKTAK